MPPTLIMTVGLPRSGKSTWARSQGAPIVCPDQIRLALHGQRYVAIAEPMVWVVTRLMIRALFGAGHPTVILDACNATPARRGEWSDLDWDRKLVVMPTPIAECLHRATADQDAYIMPVIMRIAAEFELPTMGELKPGEYLVTL